MRCPLWLSLEDPALPGKVSFSTPGLPGLAVGCGFNCGHCGPPQSRIGAAEVHRMECFCCVGDAGDLTPMINAGMVFLRSPRRRNQLSGREGGQHRVQARTAWRAPLAASPLQVRVRRVLAGAGQAVGVELAGGETIRAKRVHSPKHPL